MSTMSMFVGLTDDLQRVSIALAENGKQLGWIEFTSEQCDHFIRQVEKYRHLLPPTPMPVPDTLPPVRRPP